MFKVKIVSKTLIDIPKSLDRGVEAGLFAAAGQGEKKSVEIVRKDTGALANSIERELLDSRNARWFTNLPYNTAQEFGLPTKPSYGFTPYMRPSADLLRFNLPSILRKFVRRFLRFG